MSQSRPYYAIVAGLCASSASFFGKLSSLGQQLAENVGNKEVSTTPMKINWAQENHRVRVASCYYFNYTANKSTGFHKNTNILG